MNLSEPIMAAMIGAMATVCTAVFQLVVSWRKASNDRPKARGGVSTLLWTLTLMTAAAVGGFAYAEYRAQGTRGEAALLREELQHELSALSASTARLEKLTPSAIGGAGSAPQGPGELAAFVRLPACRGPQVGFATERTACTELDALQIAMCAPVPPGASVTGVDLFARPEDSQQPWSEARVTPGQDLHGGRFAANHVEHSEPDGSRQVCQSLTHWSDKGRTVRIVVRYR